MQTQEDVPTLDNEPPVSRVPLPDAPCDFGDCTKPWVRRIAGRFTCAEHIDRWKEIVLPPHPHDS